MTEMAPILSRRRWSSVRSIAAFVWFIGATAGCSDDPAAQDGMETGPCIQGACLTGLVCLSDVCVAPDGGSGGSGDDGGMTVPGTGPDPTASPTTTGDTAGDTTVAVDGTGCVGECLTDLDCAPRQTCEDCTCVGEPPSDTGDTSTSGANDTGTTSAEDTVGPCEPSGEGVYAECLESGPGACMSPTGACVTSGEPATGSICFFPCEDVCDCPPAPAGSEVSCDAILVGSDDTVCHLDCSRGQPCPAGALCVGGNSCVFADMIESYGDCANESGVCDESGICVVDDVMTIGAGVCSPPCQDVGDCDPPASDATVVCNPLGDGTEVCLLACNDTDECPAGMFCNATFALCMWGLDGIPTYDACLDATEPCDLGATCWTFPAAAPTHSTCGFDCQSSVDCPPPPDGTAVPTCYDVGETSCFLDCSNGETCPTGSECVGEPDQTQVCAWPA